MIADIIMKFLKREFPQRRVSNLGEGILIYDGSAFSYIGLSDNKIKVCGFTINPEDPEFFNKIAKFVRHCLTVKWCARDCFSDGL